MSVNRDQNVASNTSSLLDIPLKKRKGSRFHASLPPSDGCNTKQKKKKTDKFIVTYHDEDISHARPVKKRICESSTVQIDDDSVDTIYKNPYLNHVGSNVTSHEGETSHVSLVRKGNGQLPVSDLNTADQNQKAQANFSSAQKYFPIPNELCGIASDIAKSVCALDLTRKASVREHSEKSGNTASGMQFRSGGTGHSLVSSVTQKRDFTLPISNLKDKAARASHSSASATYIQVIPESSDGLTVNKVVSGDRTSGMQIKLDPKPSSVSWEDWSLFHNNSRSQKGCLSSLSKQKSNVGTRDFSVQRKELNCTDKPTRNSNFEAADRNIVSHPCDVTKVLHFSKSSKKYNGCAIPDSSGNLIDEPKGDAQQPYYRSSRAYDDIVTNGFCVQASTSMTPLCFKMHHQTPAPTPQVLSNGGYDLRCNTVIKSIGTPSPLPSVCSSFELPRGRLVSPFHGFKFSHGKSENVAYPKYPSSSDILSVSSSGDAGDSYTLPDKKGGCDRSLVPIVDEHDESVWNRTIPNSSTNNFVASSHKSIISAYCNSQEKSFEPDNQENLVPLKVIPQLTSVHDTALGTSGISHNLQEGKEMFQKKEILTSISDSDGERKQKNIAEDKTETTQKGPRHEWECAICLEALNSKRGISATVCGHVYCTPCITEVVFKRKECPTCRKALASAQVHPLYIFG